MKLLLYVVFFTQLLLVSAAKADIRVQEFTSLTNVAQINELGDIDFDNLVSTPLTQSGPNFSSDMSDNFAYRYSGEFLAATSDTYHFFLRSDDGSRLYIDDVLVIENDGLHNASNTLTNSIYLSAGTHYIKIEYLEKGGVEVLDLTYQTQTGLDAEPASRLLIDSVVSLGADFDNDGLIDYYDTLHDAGCDLNRLLDSRYTDYRNCDYSNQVLPIGIETFNKNFDGANFTNTDFNGAVFSNSSFRGANFSGQYSTGSGRGIYFFNSDLTGAIIERNWPLVRMTGVNLSRISFVNNNTNNANDYYCFLNSVFSELDLVRYDYGYSISSPGDSEQTYLLGIPGYGVLSRHSGSYTVSDCLNKIDVSSSQNLIRGGSDIAPRLFMYDVLRSNPDSSDGLNAIDFWVTGVSTNTGNGNSRNYPVYGDRARSGFRSATAHTSPYWEWDLGNYYQIKSLRLKQIPISGRRDELNDAIVMVSDWPFTGNPLLVSNFDSIARYELGKSATGDYEIPVGRSVRYIRIQRPKSATGQYLSFDKLELRGEISTGVTPLAGATTPLPNDYVLPTSEPGRVCGGFNPDLINPNFDVSNIVVDEVGDAYWQYADLSRQTYNGYDFSRAYADGVNFEQTQLVGANFNGARLSGANFRGANLEGADFSFAEITNADFRGANLNNAKFNDTRADCAYFSGSVPDSYSPMNSDDGDRPQVSALAADAAYGYARASSIDEGTHPTMAIDKDVGTASVTALEKSAWWELDMGAIYALKDIVLLTGLTIEQDQQLQVYLSEWPVPYELKPTQLPDFVNRVYEFAIDGDKIRFKGNQTGRYVRVMVPAAMGQLKLRLAEVSAESPALPTAPTTSLPLTPGQVSSLVPNTYSLIVKINHLISLYEQGDGEYEGVRASINNLYALNEQTISNSYYMAQIGKNIRTMLRPIASSKQMLLALQIIPPFTEPVKYLREELLGSLENPARLISGLTKVAELAHSDPRKNLFHTREKLNGLGKEIDSQVALLKRGRNYLENKLQCALYGTEADTVLLALENYSLSAMSSLDVTVNQIAIDRITANSTNARRADLTRLNNHFTRQSLKDAVQTSSEMVDAMGPFAAAITPVQLYFSQGEIYGGLTVWDILEAIEGVSDAVIDYMPGLRAALNYVTDYFRPHINSLVADVITPLRDIIGGNLGDRLFSLPTIVEEETAIPFTLLNVYQDRQEYIIPSVDSNTFVDLFNVSSESAFASCNDRLNLPAQWPAAEGDDDGDGLLNAYELNTSLTLSDNPDSDLDGLGDGFETKWNNQAPDEASKFQANNAIADELGRDTDADGLTALHEYAYNTNPFSDDTDNDGISDAMEIVYGTNPVSHPDDPRDLDRDLDGDGLSIAQELALGLDPLDGNDVSEDPDGDGVNIHIELLAGTDPFVAAPQQAADNVIELNLNSDGLTQAAATTENSGVLVIDTRDYYSYVGGVAVLDPSQIFTSEGNIQPSVLDSQLLELSYDPTNGASRDIHVIFKVRSPGGDSMIHAVVKLQGEASDPAVGAGPGGGGGGGCTLKKGAELDPILPLFLLLSLLYLFNGYRRDREK